METAVDSINAQPVTDEQRTKIIRKEIQMAYKEIRAKYPILQHQNLIGFSIFLVSICMIILSAVLYLQGKISAVVVIVSVAFWTSFFARIRARFNPFYVF